MGLCWAVQCGLVSIVPGLSPLGCHWPPSRDNHGYLQTCQCGLGVALSLLKLLTYADNGSQVTLCKDQKGFALGGGPASGLCLAEGSMGQEDSECPEWTRAGRTQCQAEEGPQCWTAFGSVRLPAVTWISSGWGDAMSRSMIREVL